MVKSKGKYPYLGRDPAVLVQSLSVLTWPQTLGARIHFLPPYSPDYNPIEMTFAYFKQMLRKKGTYSTSPDPLEELYDLSADLITSEMAQALYRNCGYVIPEPDLSSASDSDE